MSLCLRSRAFRLWEAGACDSGSIKVRVSGLKLLFISSAMRASLTDVVRTLAAWDKSGKESETPSAC